MDKGEKYLKTKELLETKIKNCDDFNNKIDWIGTYKEICEDDCDEDIIDITDDLLEIKSKNKRDFYTYDLPYDFMEKFKDELSWASISSTQDLNRDFIIKNKDYINFAYLSLGNYFKLNDSDIESLDVNAGGDEYGINWSSISMKEDLPISFIRKHKDKLNWEYLSVNSDFTEDQMVEFKDDIVWEKAVICQVYSDDFKDKYDLGEYLDVMSDKSKDFVEEREKSFEESSMSIFNGDEEVIKKYTSDIRSVSDFDKNQSN